MYHAVKKKELSPYAHFVATGGSGPSSLEANRETIADLRRSLCAPHLELFPFEKCYPQLLDWW